MENDSIGELRLASKEKAVIFVLRMKPYWKKWMLWSKETRIKAGIVDFHFYKIWMTNSKAFREVVYLPQLCKQDKWFESTFLKKYKESRFHFNSHEKLISLQFFVALRGSETLQKTEFENSEAKIKEGEEIYWELDTNLRRINISGIPSPI